MVEIGFDPWGNIDRRMDIRDAVARLTAKQREALALWLHGHTQEEIGERLGVTKMAVCYRIQCARRAIRNVLD